MNKNSLSIFKMAGENERIGSIQKNCVNFITGKNTDEWKVVKQQTQVRYQT